GLFDGLPGPPGRTGAAADLAARFGLPVLLVLDVSGQSQTAAALVRGLATHDAAVRMAGVVLNRVGSERHRLLVSDAIAALGLPATASRSLRMPPSASFIRMCSTAGAARARKSCGFRRWRTNRRRTIAIAAGCRAAIPSCTPAPWRRRPASVSALCALQPRGRCTANAVATWYWARGSSTPLATAMP